MFHLGISEVGISCISTHQPTGVRLSASRDGGHTSRQSQIERALEWQLEPVGCRIWGLLEARVLRCRFELQRDTCSFVHWLAEMVTLQEFRVG